MNGLTRRLAAGAAITAALACVAPFSANADPSTSNTLNQNPNIVQSASPWTTFQGGIIWQPDYDTPDGQLAASRTSGTYMTVNNETAPTTVAAAQPVVSEAGITSGGPVGAQYIVKVREKTPSGTLVRDVAGPTETIDSSEIGQRLVIQGPAAFTPAVGNKLDIRLSIYATLAQTDVDWIRLSTPNGAPVAGFTYSPASPVAPASIDFTSTSTDPNGDAIGCDWDFNADGLYDDGTGCNVAGQRFEFPGSYAVGLRATDIFGATDTEVKTITVAAANPQAEPPAPTGLTATPGNGTCALDWADTTADPAVIRYQVYVNQAWPGPDSTTSEYTVTGLTNGTAYDMRVGAFNGYTAGGGDGYGPWAPVPGVSCTPQTPPTPPACSDGLDNDLDGKIDYPLDPGCTSATDTDEANAPPVGDSAEDRPYDPNGPQYQPFTASTPLDPNSSAINTRLAGYRGFTLGSEGESPSIYRGTASDPLWTASGISGSFRAPSFLAGGGGSDNPLVVLDTTTKREYRFWQPTINNSARTISANGKAVSCYTQARGCLGQGEIQGPPPTGSGFSPMHGAIRPIDISRGRIDHAIRWAVNGPKTDFRWPALKYEGQNATGANDRVGMGYRVALSPSQSLTTINSCIDARSDLDALNKRGGKIIAKALQEFGLQAGDGTGGGKLLYMEASRTANWVPIMGARNSSGSFNHIGRALEACVPNNYVTASAAAFNGFGR